MALQIWLLEVSWSGKGQRGTHEGWRSAEALALAGFQSAADDMF